MSFDETDSRIIRVLASKGRASVSEVSELVNLSQTPVARRIRNLEKKGVISGYSAMIDERKLGFTFSVFVSVRLEKQIDDKLEVFEKKVRSMPEVVDCWLMTGNSDYLLRIVTRDIEEFEKFLHFVAMATRIHLRMEFIEQTENGTMQETFITNLINFQYLVSEEYCHIWKSDHALWRPMFFLTKSNSFKQL